MNNSPMPKPDKEAILDCLTRLKGVFQEAANNRKLPSAALFKALSDTFNQAVDEGFFNNPVVHDRQSYLESMIKVMHTIQPAIYDIQKEARRDVNTFAVLKMMDSKFKNEIQDFIKAVNGIAEKRQPPNKFVPPKGDFKL